MTVKERDDAIKKQQDEEARKVREFTVILFYYLVTDEFIDCLIGTNWVY